MVVTVDVCVLDCVDDADVVSLEVAVVVRFHDAVVVGVDVAVVETVLVCVEVTVVKSQSL